jgi:NAD(P)-dependent dehydrogenase (short-subunit alcohol dehydrogenase family)
MNNVLIVGGSSGVGNKLIRELLKYNYLITATYYKNKILENLKVEKFNVDINNVKSLDFFISKIKKKKFSLIFFLSSITPNKKNNSQSRFGNLNPNFFNKFMNTNCLGNIILFEKLVKEKLLIKKCKVLFFSSMAGSIEMRGKMKHNKKFGNLFYRLSKAALNCAVKNLSYDFKNKFIINSMHPGYVNVGSGKNKGILDINIVSKEIIKTVLRLNINNTGKFLNYNGRVLKW